MDGSLTEHDERPVFRWKTCSRGFRRGDINRDGLTDTVMSCGASGITGMEKSMALCEAVRALMNELFT